MQTILIGTSCLLALASACQATVKPPEEPKPAKPVTLVPGENADMHERNLELAQRARARTSAKLLWIGDSIPQGWETEAADVFDREFGMLAPLNLGVSGDRTEHVLWRLATGDYDGLRPKLVVVMIGTNNTGHRMDPPADIAAGIREILVQLKQRFPKATLALLAIFPCAETPESNARKNNEAVNALLPAIAKEQGAEWLDINRAFVDDKGALSRALMPDLLHPNRRGYEIWANAIRDSIKRWMK